MPKIIYALPPIALTAATWTPLCRFTNLSVAGASMDCEIRDITVSFDGATAANEPVEFTIEYLDSAGTWTTRKYANRINGTVGNDDNLEMMITPTVNPASDGVVMRWQVTPNGGLMILPLYGTDAIQMTPGDRWMFCANAPDAVNVSLMIGVWQ